MRYWGKQIEIDGSFYNTAMGKSLGPTPAEMAQYRATKNWFQYEGNSEAFEVIVQDLLRDIDNNPVGSILLDALDRSTRTVRIIPLTWKEQTLLNRKPCNNSVGKPTNKTFDSVIWYEPWSRLPNLAGTGGSSPHQVLVHELQHALSSVRGKVFFYSGHPAGPMPASALLGGFPNMEELFSVTYENMYLSAAGQPGRMLAAYTQAIPLGGRSDRSWYQQYGGLLDVWCDDYKDLAAQLERVYCPWNPIRVRSMVRGGMLTL